MRLQIDRVTGLTRGSYLETYEGQRWRKLSGVVFLPSGMAAGLIARDYDGGSFVFYPMIGYEGSEAPRL